MRYPKEWEGRVRVDRAGDVYLDGVEVGRVRSRASDRVPWLRLEWVAGEDGVFSTKTEAVEDLLRFQGFPGRSLKGLAEASREARPNRAALRAHEAELRRLDGSDGAEDWNLDDFRAEGRQA